ncbi:UDP-N-acetylglucosamine 4,6-dehydratase [Candidatus Photodesmus blepharus]|uniref:UDP-N-acetylglucosamine 2-epimerase n=1 Tax=Candidatus Photodesmus blepharonis TaxID=1179155 RepID=A0A084CNT9_9GAMM|nr:UDP-N-acetylglucosamine 2-epimerase (non-hydrolyzing) [Candidatus Photodesmus blepharus]KEY91468.1 UDP-N-acetylglucosamine 4,6-dehydratase [Candidatus Photodesmus blepharus]
MGAIRVLIVFGTRPEAIKMAPVVKRLEQDSRFEGGVCVTGQHKQMLDQVLDLFDISPSYNLGVMKSGQDLTDITSTILLELRDVFEDFKPDYVLVHGDTATTLSATLAAYYKKIRIGHVEAGLRTNDIYSPWPEEGNRRIASCLANIHFAPTDIAQANLLAENISKDSIVVTGNTVIDSLFMVLRKMKENDELRYTLSQRFHFLTEERRIVLITSHRRESFGDGLARICQALIKLADHYTNVDFVYPVHFNPNVREPVNHFLSNRSNIFLIEPQDYLPFVYLMNRSSIILTDSGGIQEEAPSLGKPVLVMRDTTERFEALQSGTVKLVGTSVDVIFREVSKLLSDKKTYDLMSLAHHPYGNGSASERIIQVMCDMSK